MQVSVLIGGYAEISTGQLNEIKLVLNREKFKKYITHDEVEELIMLLSMKIIVPAIYEKITDCRDLKDNMILEEAYMEMLNIL